MDLKIKIWLAGDNGTGFLGDGRYRLLRQIDQQGSLQKAADNLGISYRKAWGDVCAVERKLGFELVHRQRGGSKGGTSQITPRGRKLLDAFGSIKTEVETTAKKQFNQHLKKLLKQISQ